MILKFNLRHLRHNLKVIKCFTDLNHFKLGYKSLKINVWYLNKFKN